MCDAWYRISSRNTEEVQNAIPFRFFPRVGGINAPNLLSLILFKMYKYIYTILLYVHLSVFAAFIYIATSLITSSWLPLNGQSFQNEMYLYWKDSSPKRGVFPITNHLHNRKYVS